MDKKKYDMLKDIRTRLKNGKPTTFQERNILNMEEKKARRLKKLKSKNNAAISHT